MLTKRFIKAYSKGVFTLNEIWVDTLTGVNYFFHASGRAGGLTPLLDADGKPIVTSVGNEKMYLKGNKF